MSELRSITEENWLDAARLEVEEAQKGFLAPPIGILARGYVYRESNARVLAVYHGEAMIGLALVRDMDEPPECYELQQFMIDRRCQGRGHGREALLIILDMLRREGRYANAEVCVDRENTAMLKLCLGVGFRDTGYIDAAVPHSLNLVYALDAEQ